AEFLRRRQRLFPLAAILVFLVCLFITTDHSELGSTDFDLTYFGMSDTGVPMYKSRFGKSGVIGEQSKETLEIAKAMKLANLGVLDNLMGFIIDGQPYLTARYLFGIDGEQVPLGGAAKFPPLPDVDVFVGFMYEYAVLYTDPEQSGGEYIGTDQRIVDGYPVICEKWRFQLPKWGTVILLMGQPLTSANNVAN
ncbi:MAG: hypothetical protein ABIF77_10960, partial [bacterium]